MAAGLRLTPPYVNHRGQLLQTRCPKGGGDSTYKYSLCLRMNLMDQARLVRIEQTLPPSHLRLVALGGKAQVPKQLLGLKGAVE